MGWRKGATDLVIDGAKYVGEQVFHIFRGGAAATHPTLTKRETIAATGSQASADVYARQHADGGSVHKMRVTSKNPAVFEQQHTTIDAVADQYGLDADDIATLRSRHGDGLIDLRDLSEDDVFIGALKVNGVDLLMHPQPSNNPKMQDPGLDSAGSDGEVTYQIFDHNQIDNVVRISPFHIDELGFYSPARRAIESMDKPAATIKEILNRLDTTNSNTAKGVGHDAEDMGIIDLLRSEPDHNQVITRDDLLMLMDSMRLPVREVNVGGPGAQARWQEGGDYEDALEEAFVEFQRDHLDVTYINLNSTAGREEVNWQRDALDDDQRSFMDEFMDYVREHKADDLDPSELGQGIDEEEAVRLYWDEWAGERAEWLVENSGYVTGGWTPDGGRHTYSINGNTEDGYYTATVHVRHGPGHTETKEFDNTDDAQLWLFERARSNDDVQIDVDEGGTRWHDYTTEGVEGYQEVRMMLPEYPMSSERVGARPENYYNRAHYPEANIIVSTRFGYWTTNFGEDYGSHTVHIDEIQSDLHQQGEQFGYRTKGGVIAGYERNMNTPHAHGAIVPDAPFKKNWYQLGFKRILTEAVRQNADRISWTTGNAQLARYPESVRHLTSLQVTRNVFKIDPKTWSDIPTYEVIAIDVNGHTKHELHVAEHDLHKLMGKKLADDVAKNSDKWDVGESQSWTELGGMQVGLKGLTNLYDEKLPKYVKTLFKKYGVKPKLSGNPYRIVERTSTEREPMPIVDGKPTGLGREIKTTVFEVYSGEGEDKKFHGMFYNKNMAEQSIRENDQRVWYIDITPEMREDIKKEGVPLTFQEHKTSGRYV